MFSMKLIGRAALAVEAPDQGSTPRIHNFGSSPIMVVTSSSSGDPCWYPRGKTINAAPCPKILTTEGQKALARKLAKLPTLDQEAWKALIAKEGPRGKTVIANAQAHIYEDRSTDIPFEVSDQLTFAEILAPLKQSNEKVSWYQGQSGGTRNVLTDALLRSDPMIIDQNLIDLSNYLCRKRITELPRDLRAAFVERPKLEINPEFCLRANIRAISADALKQIGIIKLQEIARSVAEDINVSSESVRNSINNLSQDDKYDFLTQLLEDPSKLQTANIYNPPFSEYDAAEPALKLLWKSFVNSGESGEVHQKRVAELIEKISKLDESHSKILN